MAVPAVIRYPGIGVALIAEFDFVLVTVHARLRQAHVVWLFIACLIRSCSVANNRRPPIL